jgi:hypothetical protein
MCAKFPDLACGGAGSAQWRVCRAERSKLGTLTSTPAPARRSAVPASGPGVRRRWSLFSVGAAAPDLAGRCHGW